MRRRLFPLALALTALALPSPAFARGHFDPTTEFEQHKWIPIHLGPLDLSITKAVVYLMIGTVGTILVGLVLMRGPTLTRRGTVGEQIYEVAQTQVAEQGLPSKAIGRWFPYVATLMIFIWVVNLVGFLPLPLTGERWHGVPTWGIYAATSSLSVTLALALLTFVFTHFEGVRWNGPVRYFKSWIPEAPKPLLGLVLMRGPSLTRRGTVGEQIYEVAQTQVAEQGLPSKAIGRWFPYVATLMLFIWVVNMIGFVPLPLTGERWHGIPTWGIYAATSSLSVTLALALLTFVFTHFEGIRWNGPVRYFKSWIPEAPKPLLALIVPLEILGQFMRLISLSVRLFANMLAGHILILTFIGLIFILQTVVLAVFVVPIAAVFYVFEVAIVVSIQAFIFAALSAIYIGSAIEPEH